MTSFSLSRRQLLKFFGISTTVALLEPTILYAATNSDQAQPLTFTPVRLPHPLPIYQREDSFLATGIGQGSVLAPSEDVRLASYTIIDDVVVPPEYDRYVLVGWGDHVFPNPDDYFGYNCDYTAFIPFDEHDENAGYLWVNHEYVSYPASTLSPGIPEGLAGTPTTDEAVLVSPFPTGATPDELTLAARLAGLTAEERRTLIGEFYYNQGGSILVIFRRDQREPFSIVNHANNRRIHGLSGLAINAERTDGYQGVIAWGSAPHQQGDENYLIGTGPAARQVFPLSSDGLGNRIIGTAYNCSGATTPWGTVLSAEENFQGSTSGDTPFYIGVQESVLPNGTQTEYLPTTDGVVAGGTEFGLVGEKYGWMVEIDPDRPYVRSRKHTSLGRFRHENSALRVEEGNNLVAYMGDDRRGGHTWKFVSRDLLESPKSKNNSRLFRHGVLYVAHYNADGTGKWIPLQLNTPVEPVVPSEIGAAELAALDSISRDGNTRLPRRNGVAGQTSDGGSLTVTINGVSTPVSLTEAEVIASYKTRGETKAIGDVFLSDYYTSLGAVLCDAFLAANLVGGTPCARPEDLEINPRRPQEVFLAMTDGAPGSDGYPDSRIFQVSKTDEAVNGTQQSGGLYKIIEDSEDGTGLTFHWERLEQGGEVGAVLGSGFAALDNMVFDGRGNIWGVTDMSTGLHNGFAEGFPNIPTDINHTATGDVANFVGVFGNNWMFFIPTEGPNAGEIFPFAYGPTRCELTGPTFIGNTLILSVQHPSEDCVFDPSFNPVTAILTRTIEILNLDGSVFEQERIVSRGSNWPSNIEGNPNGPPRPCVICIQRKDNQNRFV